MMNAQDDGMLSVCVCNAIHTNRIHKNERGWYLCIGQNSFFDFFCRSRAGEPLLYVFDDFNSVFGII